MVSDKETLDLINRLQDKNKELEAEIANLRSDLIMKTNDYENIKRLYENAIETGQKMQKKLIEAYKKLQTANFEGSEEFAERLSHRFIEKVQTYYCRVNSEHSYKYTEGYTVDDVLSNIDNLLKEMTPLQKKEEQL